MSAKFIAIASGKGGVGKSILACSLALSLADEDLKVLVFDADFGLSSIDILCGCEVPTTIGHVIRDQRDLKDAIFTTSFGISIVSGGSGWAELVDVDPGSVQVVLNGLKGLANEFDYILLDCGPGVGEKNLPFIKASDTLLAVTTPDATSLTSVYALVKSVWEASPETEAALVVNGVSSSLHGREIAQRVQSIIGQFLGKEFPYYGSIRHDAAVAKSVFSRSPFVESSPRCHAAIDIYALTEKVMDPSGAESEEDLNFLDRLKSNFSKSKEEASVESESHLEAA